MRYQSAEFAASYGTAGQLPKAGGIEIAFAGRSNVGKSTALNKLFNRKSLARVSSVPGKTATINFYRVGEVSFVDLPGYGYAKVAKSEKARWSELMDGYFSGGRNLRLVVLLVDMRHPVGELDRQMAAFLKERGIPFLILLTKCDKLNKTQREERMSLIAGELPGGERALIPFSGVTGEGVDRLREILDKIG